jgi:Amt family ammonium transporter
LYTQAVGVAAVGAYCVIASALAWLVIKAILGARVSEEEELDGLDWGEHGLRAYPDFQSVSVGTTHRR